MNVCSEDVADDRLDFESLLSLWKRDLAHFRWRKTWQDSADSCGEQVSPMLISRRIDTPKDKTRTFKSESFELKSVQKPTVG